MVMPMKDLTLSSQVPLCFLLSFALDVRRPFVETSIGAEDSGTVKCCGYITLLNALSRIELEVQ
jgi:hypothetical protein